MSGTGVPTSYDSRAGSPPSSPTISPYISNLTCHAVRPVASPQTLLSGAWGASRCYDADV